MRAVRSWLAPTLLVALAGCAPSAEEPPAAEPEPEATAPEAQQTASLIIKHEVADFDQWKLAFDEHEGARKAAGAVWHSVARDLENENLVFVHIVGSTLAGLQDFAASDDLKTTMEKAGVKGPPELIFANDVEIQSPPAPVEGDTYTIVIQHRVADFDAWKPAYDADAPKRSEMGVVAASVSRVADDPNMVIVHATSTDLEKAKARLESEEMRTVMAEAGVEGEPVIWLAKDVETKSYE